MLGPRSQFAEMTPNGHIIAFSGPRLVATTSPERRNVATFPQSVEDGEVVIMHLKVTSRSNRQKLRGEFIQRYPPYPCSDWNYAINTYCTTNPNSIAWAYSRMTNIWKPKLTCFNLFWEQELGEDVLANLYVTDKKPIPQHYNTYTSYTLAGAARRSAKPSASISQKLDKQLYETFIAGQIMFPGKFGVADVIEEGIPSSEEQLHV